jgi:hypothetical protein
MIQQEFFKIEHLAERDRILRDRTEEYTRMFDMLIYQSVKPVKHQQVQESKPLRRCQSADLETRQRVIQEIDNDKTVHGSLLHIHSLHASVKAQDTAKSRKPVDQVTVIDTKQATIQKLQSNIKTFDGAILGRNQQQESRSTDKKSKKRERRRHRSHEPKTTVSGTFDDSKITKAKEPQLNFIEQLEKAEVSISAKRLPMFQSGSGSSVTNSAVTSFTILPNQNAENQKSTENHHENINKVALRLQAEVQNSKQVFSGNLSGTAFKLPSIQSSNEPALHQNADDADEKDNFDEQENFSGPFDDRFIEASSSSQKPYQPRSGLSLRIGQEAPPSQQRRNQPIRPNHPSPLRPVREEKDGNQMNIGAIDSKGLQTRSVAKEDDEVEDSEDADSSEASKDSLVPRSNNNPLEMFSIETKSFRRKENPNTVTKEVVRGVLAPRTAERHNQRKPMSVQNSLMTSEISENGALKKLVAMQKVDERVQQLVAQSDPTPKSGFVSHDLFKQLQAKQWIKEEDKRQLIMVY